MTELKSTPLKRDELLRGNISGTHVVEKPIIGYKKIGCRLRPRFRISQIFNGTTQVARCIAKVEIPVGATIIRPYSEAFYGVPISISDKLRTTCYKILEINPMPGDDKKTIYDAWSTYRPAFTYEKNVTYTETLNPMESIECTEGLHFFLDKGSAEAYG
jgi:hypothetical protein